ncbi:hypothetical protein [Marinagarivorans cellulosilyticus]|uniref:Protein ImuA n=1 Tax=Marinagarivorans cellulosilyticus TaxID=2721545 RepID=A0AAN2BID6_9GAMM|nr:hypothetical protein [Marinagarivorans cellulosilyticus]BCD95808.1 protein ImuA [Marinagarivorans cellulosilyticus]
MSEPNSPTSNERLARALARVDIWRGFKLDAATATTTEPTGFTALDATLRNGGWPEDGLIDLALQSNGSEWLLWLPWLQNQMRAGHTIALINPPWLPYASSLIQSGLLLDQLLIVTPQTTAQWLACWRDVAQAKVCSGVFAWANTLSYPELRKCHLLASEAKGIYAIHRPWLSQRQSSPAALRLGLGWQNGALQCQLLKQKGCVAGQQVPLQPPASIAALWQEFSPNTQPATANSTEHAPRSNVLAFNQDNVQVQG